MLRPFSLDPALREVLGISNVGEGGDEARLAAHDAQARVLLLAEGIVDEPLVVAGGGVGGRGGDGLDVHDAVQLPLAELRVDGRAGHEFAHDEVEALLWVGWGWLIGIVKLGVGLLVGYQLQARAHVVAAVEVSEGFACWGRHDCGSVDQFKRAIWMERQQVEDMGWYIDRRLIGGPRPPGLARVGCGYWRGAPETLPRRLCMWTVQSGVIALPGGIWCGSTLNCKHQKRKQIFDLECREQDEGDEVRIRLDVQLQSPSVQDDRHSITISVARVDRSEGGSPAARWLGIARARGPSGDLNQRADSNAPRSSSSTNTLTDFSVLGVFLQSFSSAPIPTNPLRPTFTMAPTYKLLCLENPLLDIQAITPSDDALLEKYGLKANDAILAEEKHLGLYAELEARDAKLIAGGAAQNTARGAQYILPPNSVVYLGAVGDDKYAATLDAACKAAGLATEYLRLKEHPTGRCGAVITGANRSLCTDLGAANHYTLDHLQQPHICALAEAADFFYVGGYHLTVSPPAALALGKEAARRNVPYAFGMGAPFIPEFFAEPLGQLLPYIDYIFCNETEAATWAKGNGVADTSIPGIAKAFAASPKVNEKRQRTVIITQGTDPTVVATGDSVQEFPVHKIADSEINDTNGAGDAFAGGFLAGLVEGKDIKTNVDMGQWLAKLSLTQLGPSRNDARSNEMLTIISSTADTLPPNRPTLPKSLDCLACESVLGRPELNTGGLPPPFFRKKRILRIFSTKSVEINCFNSIAWSAFGVGMAVRWADGKAACTIQPAQESRY
ncbi:hypothetical protein FH972_022003 [Carpinus fangiana]|uniref:adenosine kinase n=1 Tax=Carpinus fangiana TaxID=176857 RepID=A0A5N6KRC2_9ROSI|nr:hypothetical protein FH972_022003 [Carpinus fangiana]